MKVPWVCQRCHKGDKERVKKRAFCQDCWRALMRKKYREQFACPKHLSDISFQEVSYGR